MVLKNSAKSLAERSKKETLGTVYMIPSIITERVIRARVNPCRFAGRDREFRLTAVRTYMKIFK